MKNDQKMTKLVLQLFSSFMLFLTSAQAFAADIARAQWTDASHMTLKLPQGLSMRTGLQFYLAHDALSAFQISPQALALPLITSSGNFVSLSTAHLNKEQIDLLLRQPTKLFTLNSNGQIVDSTAIQLAGILDHLYYYDGNDLGATFHAQNIRLKLWAPTAQQIRLYVYKTADEPAATPSFILPMQREHAVWTATLPRDYEGYYYLYEVQVYQPVTDRMETSLVTDPYSLGLSLNSSKTQIMNLDNPDTKPIGWDHLQKPLLKSLNDSVIYELHMRDFSATDKTVPEMHRGGYLAFTHNNSDGMKHLQALSQAGMTHVHLLPFNDLGSVNEDKKTWQNFTGPSTDLEEPQNIINRIRNQDPYAWGYDPVHYFAPEGSYAVATDGMGKAREVRTMVQSLNRNGLRVIQDVVFNRTLHSGIADLSIFDRIVPLYYYRLNMDGSVANSSCCSDTASENRMMEKLMVDAVVMWAKHFKIDGFRFDLMSFHTHDNMIRIKQALNSLTLEKDGVDGSRLLIYGEGWSFGSLYSRAPQKAMTQLNSFGLGIGFFNDRIRDAIRGGTTDSTEKSDQGFVSGLYFDFNQEPANRNTPQDLQQQKLKLLHLGDVIKAGLAGNLRDYSFREHMGSTINAGSLSYRGAVVANSAHTLETVNYVSAHDGHTLWDAIQAKAPFYTPDRLPRVATIEEKRRMAQLALSLVVLGKGIPFVESGSEFLRSKNGDKDSYDSGDFFNAIDWTLQNNGWGKGLPGAWKNYNDWSFWSPRLNDPAMQVTPEHIQNSFHYFLALLKVRKSSPLFTLSSLQEVSAHVSFIDNENQPEPGLIAMLLRDKKQPILVLFNASRLPRVFSHSTLQYRWKLHPLLDEKVDPVLRSVVLNPSKKSINLPGRSTVILVGGESL